MVAWYVYSEDEFVGATLAFAEKGKYRSTWNFSKTILKNSKYSLGNPMLFQDPRGRIHLLYVTIKVKLSPILLSYGKVLE
jgi:hypothetical protein